MDDPSFESVKSPDGTGFPSIVMVNPAFADSALNCSVSSKRRVKSVPLGLTVLEARRLGALVSGAKGED